MKKRLLALALAVVMVCGLLPAASAANSTATVTQVVPYKYNYVGDFSEGLAVVRNGNGWGAIDATGKEVIPCGTFDGSWVGEFHDGCLSVGTDNGRRGEAREYQLVTWSFVDVTGKTIFPEAITRTYQNWGTAAGVGPESAGKAIRFHDGLAAVELDPNDGIWDYGSKWGFIDPTGKVVVPCKYDEVSSFSDGLAAVGVGDWSTDYKYGFIDKTGKEIVPPKYDRVKGFSDGMAAVELDGWWGFVDATGREVIPCQYSSAEAFENGRAVVKGSTGQIANGRTVYAEGVIDKSGNVVVPFGQYKAPDGKYHDELKAVQKNGKWGFVDQARNLIIPTKYDTPSGVYLYVPSFTNGLAAVYLSGKGYGYIDLQGNEVLPCQYGSARRLSDGMLAVDLDGKWGFVRVEGLPTTPSAPISSAADLDFAIENGVLTKYTGPGGDVAIPGNVTSIGVGAFDYSHNVTSVTIPNSVTVIREYAFDDCTNLTDVYYNGSEAQWKAIHINWGNSPLQSATIHYNNAASTQPTTPDTSKDFQINKNGTLTKYKGSGGHVVIPDGVTAIGYYAFFDCASLTGVTIPNSVTHIEETAFQNCTSLTSVTIPDSVTSIGLQAFWSCTGLTNVTIGNGVTSLGIHAFGNCENLTNVTMGNSVTTIEHNAFHNCTSLTNFSIPSSVTSIESGAFQNCSSLASVAIPGGVTTIEGYTFDSCTGLTSVFIPAGVTTIKKRAFIDCFGLTDVYYGGSEAQWKSITIEQSNEPLHSATIHYNSAMPAQPVQPAPQPTTAYASTQTVTVDGKPVTFHAYALKDQNGNDTNYIKLRDVADVLSGSAAQFQVGWDGSIAITTGQMYIPNGTENIQNFAGNQSYAVSTSPVTINGVTANLEAITLTDANGGGYTYFKLRDLGAALGFNVSWSADTGITIDPNSPYNAND